MDDTRNPAGLIDSVKDYYGKVLKSSADLKTSACCLVAPLPPHVAAALAHVHPEIKDRFYGCGSPIPAALEGATVLDLGCGAGRDCYVMAQLAGPTGKVIGVDMTAEQLEVARRHLDYHAEKSGYANLEFRDGYIEDLRTAGIEDASVDVVVSNCVLNLSPDKPRVFREIFRVLKPGGELYFSDVFADRRVPAELAQDPVLIGECLGGALYFEDFRRLIAQAGCADARVCSNVKLDLRNAEIERKAGFINFHSMTVRAFKLALEDRCEDYGQVAHYLGTLPEFPHHFALDDHHLFETGRPMLVCGNTADLLAQTRYHRHFRVEGDKSRHYGLFDCAPAAAPAGSTAACC
ncbi:MAG TPA: methyltransferase domain-containing protein [Candidatus Binatia bacterium]|nr:methyltransferase domain-containing protein [Candidatus Binatia bacterium]